MDSAPSEPDATPVVAGAPAPNGSGIGTEPGTDAGTTAGTTAASGQENAPQAAAGDGQSTAVVADESHSSLDGPNHPASASSSKGDGTDAQLPPHHHDETPRPSQPSSHIAPCSTATSDTTTSTPADALDSTDEIADRDTDRTTDGATDSVTSEPAAAAVPAPVTSTATTSYAGPDSTSTHARHISHDPTPSQPSNPLAADRSSPAAGPRKHHHQRQSSTEAAPAAVPSGKAPDVVVPHFVAPSSYLLRPRPSTLRNSMAASDTQDAPAPPAAPPRPPAPPSPLDRDQRQGITAIRDFLKVRTSYDVLPLSFRLIVLDTSLLIKRSLNVLIQNAIVSAPLWDSEASRFAGLLTSTDYINVVQYYCQFPDEMRKLDQFRLSSLRDIEKAIGAIPIETVSVHPSRPLYEACRRMLMTRARRIPLVDVDDETGKETVVSVITQYRILKFIAVNNEHNTVLLKKSLRELKLGTYTNLVTTTMNSTVLDVVHLMVERNISCVPIVDAHGRVLNAFEAVDVIPCIKGGAYEELDGTVGDALCNRPDDSSGIHTCSESDRLDSIFDTIRKGRVHRLIVVDDDNKLRGVVSLHDILKYVLLDGEETGLVA